MKNLIFAALAATALMGCSTPEQKAQKAVALALKDPTSPIFSEVKTFLGSTCGKVNGRNSFGAYAGAKRFIHSEAAGVQFEGKESGFESVDAMTACFFDLDYDQCHTGEFDKTGRHKRCLDASIPK